MPAIITFKEAIATAGSSPHLLLGNGFSIACRPQIFVYGKLFEQADFTQIPRAERVFGALKTTDFERVIRALRDFSQIAPVYFPDSDGSTDAARDADALREILVRTIAKSHPARPSDLKGTEYTAVRGFLSHFNKIFTLNYDLLLYWALMQSEIDPQIACDDGFRKPEDDPDSEYVTWEPDNTYSQSIYFLHGALHLFDSGPELQKYTWIGSGVALIDQIRAALQQDLFPLFVSEGTSDEKLARINHSGYLSKARRSLLQIGGSIFIHGHSLAENDEHIINAIEHSKVTHVLVGIHGDPSTASNRAIMARALLMPTHRRKKTPMKVSFYDSSTAAVWKE